MSNGSDINVGSIEEAIEILRNAIRCNEKQFEELGTHILLQDDEQEAIKIVLGNLEILSDMQRSADRELKRQKQINEEHQKINGELRKKVKELEVLEDDMKDKRIVYIDEPEFKANYISKQKIKDKMKDLEKKMEYEQNERALIHLQKQRKVLQELLEEEDKHV